jgi:hypothetical protein
MKQLFSLTLLCLFSFSLSAAPNLVLENPFEAKFTIDSAYTTDGVNYQVSASGEAGEYGRVYLSYVFTDKQELGDRGEFTGHAWAQSGENVNTATLQGIYVKQGTVFKLYTLDAVSNGKFNFAIGTLNFIEKTLNFEVAEIVTE